MAKYVVLFSWTDQGIAKFKEAPQRKDEFGSILASLGARLEHAYWTLGAYDAVAIIEAPDDETATAALMQSSSQGNSRTTTLRAFTREDMARILEKAG